MSGRNNNLIDAILCAGTTRPPWNDKQFKPECKATIKLIVALLVSKLGTIQGFNYERLYAHFIRPFCCEDEIQEIIHIFFLENYLLLQLMDLFKIYFLKQEEPLGKRNLLRVWMNSVLLNILKTRKEGLTQAHSRNMWMSFSLSMKITTMNSLRNYIQNTMNLQRNIFYQMNWMSGIKEECK